jgi:hypothetical protein
MPYEDITNFASAVVAGTVSAIEAAVVEGD